MDENEEVKHFMLDQAQPEFKEPVRCTSGTSSSEEEKVTVDTTTCHSQLSTAGDRVKKSRSAKPWGVGRDQPPGPNDKETNLAELQLIIIEKLDKIEGMLKQLLEQR